MAPILEATGLAKTYRSLRRRRARAPRRRPRARPGEFVAVMGRERLRQVDPPPPARRARPADGRPGHARRAAGRRRCPRPSGAPAPAPARFRVPVLQPDRRPVGRRTTSSCPRCWSASRPATHAAREASCSPELGLADKADAPPAGLSGGQQQRVALARALVNRPAVLLADEPTGNLDSASAKEVLALLRREHERGQTILLVTHDARVAAAADRVVTMRDGLVVDETRLGAPATRATSFRS